MGSADNLKNLAKLMEGLYAPGGPADKLIKSSRYAPQYPVFTPGAWSNLTTRTVWDADKLTGLILSQADYDQIVEDGRSGNPYVTPQLLEIAASRVAAKETKPAEPTLLERLEAELALRPHTVETTG